MRMDNVTRTRIFRLNRLDRCIRAGRYPNCSSFARQLAEEDNREKPFDRKTIQRDIDFLRDQMRAPVEYDPVRKGFFYRNPSWSFPAMELSEGELLQLLLAEQMARQFRGTPLADTLDGLFQKIRFHLSGSLSVDPVIVRQQVSFHSHPVRPIDPRAWTSIFQALRGDRVLSIRYRGIGDLKAAARKVEPLHLGCVDGEWYLVAHCRTRDALRHFSVSRIESVKVLEERFDSVDFDPEAYFSNRFGRYIGPPGEEQWVRIRFAPSAVPWVLEREWHPKQKIRKEKSGSILLEFPAPSLFEAKRWVLQWGAEAEVVGPEALRSQIASEACAILENGKEFSQ